MTIIGQVSFLDYIHKRLWPMIVIVDYGMEIWDRSLISWNDWPRWCITLQIEDITCADKLILPGGGCLWYCIDCINCIAAGFLEYCMTKSSSRKRYVLDMSGSQLLFKKKRRRYPPGLGFGSVATWWSSSFVNPNPISKSLTWVGISPIRKKSPCVTRCSVKIRFYFVHSYHAVCSDQRTCSWRSLWVWICCWCTQGQYFWRAVSSREKPSLRHEASWRTLPESNGFARCYAHALFLAFCCVMNRWSRQSSTVSSATSGIGWIPAGFSMNWRWMNWLPRYYAAANDASPTSRFCRASPMNAYILIRCGIR